MTIKVDEGNWVKKAQILAGLNNTSFKNAYQGTSITKKQTQDTLIDTKIQYKINIANYLLTVGRI